MVDTDKYLSYALRLFEKQGGRLREGYIQNFRELKNRLSQNILHPIKQT